MKLNSRKTQLATSLGSRSPKQHKHALCPTVGPSRNKRKLDSMAGSHQVHLSPKRCRSLVLETPHKEEPVISKRCLQQNVSISLLPTLAAWTRVEAGTEVCFHLSSPLLLNVHDEHLWKGGKIHHDNVGCSIRVSRGSMRECQLMGAFDDANRLSSLLERKLSSASAEVGDAMYDLLCRQSDSMGDVLEAASRVNDSSSRLVGDVEMEFLAQGNLADSQQVRQRVFLRRLSLPMLIIVEGSSSNKESAATIIESVSSMRFSFLDVLLRVKGLQARVLDALLIQICALEKASCKSLETKRTQLSLLTTIRKFSKSNHVHGTLRESIVMALSVAPTVRDKLKTFVPAELIGRGGLDGISAAKACRRDVSPLQSRQWSRNFEHTKTEEREKPEPNPTRSCPDSLYEMVAARRKELVAAHIKGKKVIKYTMGAPGSSKKTLSLGQTYKGSPFFTARDISLEDFLEEAKFMSIVQSTFPRPFVPGQSRPKLQTTPLSRSAVEQLKALYFDEDGSLSDSIRRDIDTSAKHGYINFQNHMCIKERRDLRWQVPIKKHGCVASTPTRASTEKLLEGIIDQEYETLCDLGILIGGTEDQSLHHDTARQVVTWLPEDPGAAFVVPVTGWEVDRLEYNAAMSSPVAPSSILVGMSDEVFLGVQNDQIIRCDDAGVKRCKVRGGTGESFEIVRENDHLVVIRVNGGAMFTGDFPHAGVRNVASGTPEDHLMDKLNERINRVMEIYPAEDPIGQTRAIVDILCNTPGLIRLCRLHCSTEMQAGNLRIPANTIGFSNCLPNPPDPRCCQYDDESDDECSVNSDLLMGDDGDDDAESRASSLCSEAEFMEKGAEEDSVPTLCDSYGFSSPYHDYPQHR